MTANIDRDVRAIKEKIELLTGERSEGSRRAVLLSEWNGLIQNLADQNAVIQKKLTELSSQMGDSSASLTQELLTLASQTTALAQTVTTLKTALAGSVAEIQDTRRAVSLGDMALAENIQQLSSTIGGNAAQIVEEKRTRTTETSALAQSISTLSATVNGNSAAITTLQSATAAIDGALSVLWSVQGTIDGVTGGLRLTGLKKADGSGTAYNLIIDANTTINGSLLVNGTVNQSSIDGNTINRISNGGFAQNSGANNNIAVTVYCRANAQVLVVATYDGGDSSASGSQFFGAGGGGYWGELRTTVTDPNGNSTTIASQGINSFLVNVGVNFFFGTVDKYWSTSQTTAIGRFIPLVTGNHTFYVRPFNDPAVPTYLSQLTKIAVFELAK